MKIAYILFTDDGLECDDRIRKEMFSIKELLVNVEFKIFGFHRDNHAETGVLSYGVPYELISIKNRGGKKDIISELCKEYDLYSQIAKKVKDYDLLWVCDEQPFFFPLFSQKTIVWDLHEIPHPIIGSRVKNTLFNYMERRCKWLIHANKERLNYLLGEGVIKDKEKNLVLRNYPDKAWLALADSEPESFIHFKEWLGKEEYVYIQGLSGEARCPWETLSAIMEAHVIKAVVIGPVSSDIKDRLKKKYPDAEDFIYYTGRVVQSDTAAFISHCKFSIVFYRIDKPNNRYCEPNRMFQTLGMGKPVIVGCNEPMANTVLEYGNGIVLDSDGSSVKDNVDAIKGLLNNYDKLRIEAEKNKERFSWTAQLPVFSKIFSV